MPTRWLPACEFLAIGLLIAACGSSGHAVQYPEAAKRGQQILADARAATSKVKTVRMVGTINLQGKSLHLDFHINGNSGAYGVVILNGFQTHMITQRRAIYFKAPATFYRANHVPRRAARALNRRWVILPSRSSLRKLRRFTSTTSLFRALFDSAGTVTKIPGVRSVRGTPAVGLRDKEGERLYVAVKGPPLPLELDGSSTSASGQMRFLHYDEPVTVIPPVNPVDLGR